MLSLTRSHTLFNFVLPETVDLAAGAPSEDLMPTRLLQRASQLALSDDQSWAGEYAEELQPSSALQYGPHLGDSAFRELLAKFLTRRYKTNVPVLPEWLAITPGASIGLLCILLAFTNAPGRRNSTHGNFTKRAFLPQPTYHLAFQSFADAGFVLSGDDPGCNVDGIPEDEDGIRLDILEQRLQELSEINSVDGRSWGGNLDDQTTFQFVLYLVPSHSNPSGTTLPDLRRQHLVRLAHRYNMLVICDDVYDLLYYHPSPGDASPLLDRIIAYDVREGGGNHVISNCTFSKVLGPGMRCGWVEAKPSLLARLLLVGAWFSGGGPAHLSSRLIMPLLTESALKFIEDPSPPSSASALQTQQCALDRHLDRISEIYAARLAAMIRAVDEHLVPLGISRPVHSALGGYFLWLRLPEYLRSPQAQMQLKSAMDDEQVLCNFGSLFFLNTKEADTGYLRLTWAYNKEERIELGCARIATAVLRLGSHMCAETEGQIGQSKQGVGKGRRQKRNT